NKHKKFYHEEGSNNRSCAVLRYAMTKLRENRFVTLGKQLYDCICIRRETFMNDNESPVLIPNFDFILRFQRNKFRNSGVAIYRNETDEIIIKFAKSEFISTCLSPPVIMEPSSDRMEVTCGISKIGPDTSMMDYCELHASAKLAPCLSAA
ncbi:hypothetical protein PV325_006272, partial [Microctonus aethiopoides]